MKKLIIVCLLALGLSACNACSPKNIDTVVTVEKSVRNTVVSVSAIVEPLVCDITPRKILGNTPCLKFLDVLEPTVDLAIEYNLALQSGQIPKIAETVAGITKLIEAIKTLVPMSSQKDEAITELTKATALASRGQ